MGVEWLPLTVEGQTVLVRQLDGELQVGDTGNLGAEIAAHLLTGRHHPVHEVLQVLRQQLADGHKLTEELAALTELRTSHAAGACSHPLSLAVAAQSGREYVVDAVAANPRTPSSVLARLVLSTRPYAIAAAHNPTLGKSDRLRLLRSGAGRAARRQDLDAEEQEAALHSASSEVIDACVASGWITPSQLRSILRRVSRVAREWVAMLGRVDLCEVLLEQNASLTERGHIVERWMPVRPGDAGSGWMSLSSPAVVERVLLLLAQDRAADIRERVCHRAGTPASVLERLAGDREEKVRFQVAIHRNCPPQLLDQLAEDPSQLVSEAARERLAELGALKL